MYAGELLFFKIITTQNLKQIDPKKDLLGYPVL
jgi:hypothetical protein